MIYRQSLKYFSIIKIFSTVNVVIRRNYCGQRQSYSLPASSTTPGLSITRDHITHHRDMEDRAGNEPSPSLMFHNHEEGLY